MKVNSNIKKYIKNMDGNLLGIGIKDESILKEIESNKKIINCDLLNSINKTIKFKSKRKLKKKIYIKKLRKKYKKNNIDFLIVNIEEVDNYLKFFIKDSIYITSNNIYYFIPKEYDVDIIIKRYKRYTSDIELIKCDDGIILKINTINTKNNFFKDKIYFIIDTLNNIIDLIADILIA